MGNRQPKLILRESCIDDMTKLWVPGSFLEVGAGTGHMTKVFLSRGYGGACYDLGEKSRCLLKENLAAFGKRMHVADSLANYLPIRLTTSSRLRSWSISPTTIQPWLHGHGILNPAAKFCCPFRPMRENSANPTRSSGMCAVTKKTNCEACCLALVFNLCASSITVFPSPRRHGGFLIGLWAVKAAIYAFPRKIAVSTVVSPAHPLSRTSFRAWGSLPLRRSAQYREYFIISTGVTAMLPWRKSRLRHNPPRSKWGIIAPRCH